MDTLPDTLPDTQPKLNFEDFGDLVFRLLKSELETRLLDWFGVFFKGSSMLRRNITKLATMASGGVTFESALRFLGSVGTQNLTFFRDKNTLIGVDLGVLAATLQDETYESSEKTFLWSLVSLTYYYVTFSKYIALNAHRLAFRQLVNQHAEPDVKAMLVSLFDSFSTKTPYDWCEVLDQVDEHFDEHSRLHIYSAARALGGTNVVHIRAKIRLLVVLDAMAALLKSPDNTSEVKKFWEAFMGELYHQLRDDPDPVAYAEFRKRFEKPTEEEPTEEEPTEEEPTDID